MPLLSLIKSAESRVKHAAYADDLGGARTLLHLKSVLTEGYHCSEIERKLISLPVRFVGLGIPIFSEIAYQEYVFSKRVTSQLSKYIKQEATELTLNNNEMKKKKIEIAHEKTKSHEEKLAQLRESTTFDQRKANELSCMKGASSWLTSLPLEAENFVLNKREFHDSIRLRYRWHLKFMPTIRVCGKHFSVDHAMSCKNGGYIHHRHNEISTRQVDNRNFC